MLLPDLHDLITFKHRKSNRIHPALRKAVAHVPGNHHSPFRGQGLEFDCVREYVPGDDIRNIDWRVTARTGKPHLKVFKQERERNVYICVDMNSYMRFGTKKTFKSVQAARIAAFLGWQAIAEHDRVGACLFGDVVDGLKYFPPKRTRDSFCHLLKTLTEPPAKKQATTVQQALDCMSNFAPSGSLIYVISDFSDLHLNDDLKRLNSHADVIFISVNDCADQAMYPLGAIRFTNHSAKLWANTDSLQGRAVYAAEWEENRKQLYTITARCKVPLLELTTESDIRQELPLGLKNLARRKR